MELRQSLIPTIIFFVFSATALFGICEITHVSPNHGASAGGDMVTISGTGFTEVTEVLFGQTPATIVTSSDTEITVKAPESVPGTIHILASVGSVTSDITSTDRYTYQGSWSAYVTGKGLYPSFDPFSWRIDLSDHSLISAIPLEKRGTPYGIAITPDGRTAYIVNSGDDEPGTTFINTIDLAHDISTSIGCPGHEFSDAVAVSPDEMTLYPTFFHENSVGYIDLPSQSFLGTLFSTGEAPVGIAITPDGRKIYIANTGDGTITVFTKG